MQNDSMISGYKFNRVLVIYSKLIRGEVINKYDEARYFDVTPRSIQRDIDDLRCFFTYNADSGNGIREVVFDKQLGGYRLTDSSRTALTEGEVLAVCKILLESRAFTREEMSSVINKLLDCCSRTEDRCTVKELVSNELHHYTELCHHKSLIDSIRDIGRAVQQHLCMKIVYTKQDGTTVERTVQPVGIMFSEFYFYLTAFIKNIDRKTEFKNPDDIFPTIYRIDRIQSFDITGRHFDIPYRDRFEEGEFRKRIQFMYGGDLRHIRFLYKGINPEAVLDRLPTAKIIEKTDDGFIITAEVLGSGADMWIKCQGDVLEIL